MNRALTGALALALGAGVCGGAAAQELRDYDQVRNQRVSEDSGVRLRFSIPFGQAAADREDPRLSLAFSHNLSNAQTANFDMMALSFTDSGPRAHSPFQMNAAGDGAWYTQPKTLVLLGLGLGAAWAIYDHNNDDDDPPPPNNS